MPAALVGTEASLVRGVSPRARCGTVWLHRNAHHRPGDALSTNDPQQPEPARPTRTRTPAQAEAWAKVEREGGSVPALPTRPVVQPVVVVRVVIGVLMAVAALTVFFVMAPDVPGGPADDRRDALLVIGLVGAGAALATSGVGRRTVEPPD